MVTLRSKLFNQEFKKDFVKLLKTKNKANEFFDFVDRVFSETYKTDNFSLESLLEGEQPVWFQKVSSKLKDSSLEVTRDSLEDLKKYVLGLEEINIKMPFEPSESFLDEVYKVFERADFRNYLINVEVDKNSKLTTGFSIEGKYLRVSLRKLIHTYLLSKNVTSKHL